jgi:hypothetical protein
MRQGEHRAHVTLDVLTDLQTDRQISFGARALLMQRRGEVFEEYMDSANDGRVMADGEGRPGGSLKGRANLRALALQIGVHEGNVRDGMSLRAERGVGGCQIQRHGASQGRGIVAE